MTFKLMSLQIHLRVEDNKLLLLTFLVKTWEVVTAKVLLKSFVIDEVGRCLPSSPTITKMAAFVTFSAVYEELIISVEALPAETALWMALEPALIYSTRIVVAKLFVPLQLLLCE